MDEQEKFFELIKEFAARLPKFPDGRIDYSNSKEAPVVTVFVGWGGKVLLLKRSGGVSTYQGKWNTVAGYIDEVKTLEEIVLKELKEEIGIVPDDIASIKYGQPFTFTDEKINRTWIIHPELVVLSREPEIRLDFEHTEYAWISPQEMGEYDTVENLYQGYERVKNAVFVSSRTCLHSVALAKE